MQAIKDNVSKIKAVVAMQKEPGKTAILEGIVKRVQADAIRELTAIYYNDVEQAERFLSKFDMPKGLWPLACVHHRHVACTMGR